MRFAAFAATVSAIASLLLAGPAFGADDKAASDAWNREHQRIIRDTHLARDREALADARVRYEAAKREFGLADFKTWLSGVTFHGLLDGAGDAREAAEAATLADELARIAAGLKDPRYRNEAARLVAGHRLKEQKFDEAIAGLEAALALLEPVKPAKRRPLVERADTLAQLGGALRAAARTAEAEVRFRESLAEYGRAYTDDLGTDEGSWRERFEIVFQIPTVYRSTADEREFRAATADLLAALFTLVKGEAVGKRYRGAVSTDPRPDPPAPPADAFTPAIIGLQLVNMYFPLVGALRECGRRGDAEFLLSVMEPLVALSAGGEADVSGAHAFRATFYRAVGEARLERGQFAEALVPLEAASEILRTTLGDGHPALLAVTALIERAKTGLEKSKRR